MTWLLPLGFLGLLGIVVLIIIYIIKPNYQNKFVSSTFVWKLSLKYKKKRIPINRLRSLLMLLCQILIITACALILAKPVIAAEKVQTKSEKILIIDASASMLVARDSETRFERAVAQAKTEAESVLTGNGSVTVILAGETAELLVQRAGTDMREEVLDKLDGLVEGSLQCSYSDADIDGALELAEQVLLEEPESQVLLYSGMSYYSSANDITVVNVAQDGEWNAAILDVTVEKEDNYCTFIVTVASYGIPAKMTLHCDVHNANGAGETFTMKTSVECDGTSAKEISFKTVNDATEGVETYEYAYIYLTALNSDDGVDDWFTYDNYSYVYGEKATVKVQYYSNAPNSFFYAILTALRSEWKNWNLEVTEVRTGGTPELTGYDFYIFEHHMPEAIPTDGIVMLVDVDAAPLNAGFVLGSTLNGVFTLASGESHPIMDNVTAENIMITQYTRIVNYDDSYTPLMYCGGDPVFLVRNEPTSKVAIFSINAINRSDFAMLLEFPRMMVNMFNYFLPSTISDTLVEVGEEVTLNARAEALKISYSNRDNKTETIQLDTFPSTLKLTVPGIYTITQTLLSGETLIENFYVKISAVQSDIFQEVELNTLYREEAEEEEDYDLLVYFAAALVALLFLEWWLQSREYF